MHVDKKPFLSAQEDEKKNAKNIKRRENLDTCTPFFDIKIVSHKR